MALRGVAETEARCATELVVKVKVEKAGFALSASSSLNVLFARTESCFRIARCSVVVRSMGVTVTRLTSVGSEVVMIGFTSITLFASDSRLALTLSFRVALQRS